MATYDRDTPRHRNAAAGPVRPRCRLAAGRAAAQPAAFRPVRDRPAAPLGRRRRAATVCAADIGRGTAGVCGGEPDRDTGSLRRSTCATVGTASDQAVCNPASGHAAVRQRRTAAIRCRSVQSKCVGTDHRQAAGTRQRHCAGHGAGAALLPADPVQPVLWPARYRPIAGRQRTQPRRWPLAGALAHPMASGRPGLCVRCRPDVVADPGGHRYPADARRRRDAGTAAVAVAGERRPVRRTVRTRRHPPVGLVAGHCNPRLEFPSCTPDAAGNGRHAKSRPPARRRCRLAADGPGRRDRRHPLPMAGDHGDRH